MQALMRVRGHDRGEIWPLSPFFFLFVFGRRRVLPATELDLPDDREGRGEVLRYWPVLKEGGDEIEREYGEISEEEG